MNILNLLIAHGANVEQKDGQGYTPLMKAARIGKTDMVAALLAAGTRVDLCSYFYFDRETSHLQS